MVRVRDIRFKMSIPPITNHEEEEEEEDDDDDDDDDGDDGDGWIARDCGAHEPYISIIVRGDPKVQGCVVITASSLASLSLSLSLSFGTFPLKD